MKTVQGTITDVGPTNHAPVITSDGGLDTATKSVAENSTAVTTVTATDADPGTVLSYALVGGADQSKFQISSSGALSFIAAPNFEDPKSAQGTNSYVVQVRVSDNGSPVMSDTQTITVNVTDVNDIPPNWVTPTSLSTPENSTAVATLNVTDPDGGTPTFSINGGNDAAKFSINGNQLVFVSAPDFENPADSDHDNTYIVQVRAFDGVQGANRTFTVNVTDVDDPLPVLSISATDANKAEGSGGGTTLFTFTVSHSGSTAMASSVFWSMIPGANPAADSADFSGATGGTLGWAVGDGAAQTITLRVLADAVNEFDENFSVALSSPTGATIGTGTANGLIRNDDGPLFTEGSDTVTLTQPGQTWHALGGDDKVTGTSGPDTIYGDGGNDTLDGNGGGDALYGGIGDDTYMVTTSGDQLFEVTGEGYDRVYARVSYALPAGQEIEQFSTSLHVGTALINLTGNEFAQAIFGNAGDNVLDDGSPAAPDTLIGLGGNDVYMVSNAADQIVEATDGTYDRVYARVSYTLPGGQEIEQFSTSLHVGTAPINLTGNEFAQAIIGNAGDNVLDDGSPTAADTLIGLGGNDTYLVSNANDQVVEVVGGGFDRVYARVSYTLPSGQEIEQLSTSLHVGTAPINLTGNEFANIVMGNDGDNVLDGKGGADTLIGRLGGDSYVVDNPGDIIVEAPGEGSDRVYASVSYKLTAGASIETMSTDFNTGTAAINLTGNELAQLIYGNAGDNVLDGGGAADTLAGLGGNDSYLVNNPNEDVIEAVGQGSDRVYAGVSWNMTVGSEIEMLTTDFNADTKAINLRGNELANVIIGNAGTNILVGRDGNDTLWGLGGADFFLFETAPSTATNVDTIGDFNPADDTIVFVASMFPGFAQFGTLNAGAFFAGMAAHDADDRVIYDPATGNLFFDPDGTGGAAQVTFAVVSPGLAMNEGVFRVI